MKKPRSKTVNRGVTATSSDINESMGSTEKSKSMSKDGLQSIKEELQNVIELMGPSTPHLTLTSSEEADNEDSVMETSIYSSVVQVKQTSWKDTKTSTVDTPRDISNLSALPIDTTESADTLNKNVNVEHNSQTCPCRLYYNQVQSNFNHQGVNFPPQQGFQSHESVNMLNMQRTVETNKGKSRERVMSFLNLLKFKKQKELSKEPLELYKINILQASESEPPKRLIFDLVNDLPKPEVNTVATNTSKIRVSSPLPLFYQQMQPPRIPNSMSNVTLQVPQPEQQKSPAEQHAIPERFRQEKPTRVDVYYFDHGNSSYLRTTDAPPVLVTDVLAEKTEAYTTKFWAEIFGTIHIPFAFLTTFFLQLLRFILQSLIRPLTVGLTQLASDYFFKPFLTVCFNAIIQPPAILLFNIFTSLRDLCDPIAEGFGYFLREIANLCRSMRIVEIRNISRPRLSATPLRRARIRRRS